MHAGVNVDSSVHWARKLPLQLWSVFVTCAPKAARAFQPERTASVERSSVNLHIFATSFPSHRALHIRLSSPGRT